MKIWPPISFGLVALLAFAAPTFPNVTNVQPHEAIYDVTVREWNLPGAVQSYFGSQILRLDATCQTWRLTGRLAITAQLQNGRTFQFESDISHSEAKDGTHLTFDHKPRMNGRTLAPIRGVASRPRPGEVGRVQINQPEYRTVDLPGEALFPIASFLWTRDQVKNGARTMNYVLYDGSGPEPIRVFELLTGTPKPLSPSPSGDAELLRVPSWRTIGSFHRYTSTAAEPTATIAQNIHDNGIGSSITFDIGLAVVQLKLHAIRKLSEPSC